MATSDEAVITLREVYDLVLELKTEMAPTPRTLSDHEDRIRDLERKVWSFSGISALAAVVISQVVTLLLK
jgi:hypothetical protein